MEEIMKLSEKIEQKIIDIDNDRDKREQQYYRDTIRLSSEYSVMDSALLSQKTFLKEILKEMQNSLVEKNNYEPKQ